MAAFSIFNFWCNKVIHCHIFGDKYFFIYTPFSPNKNNKTPLGHVNWSVVYNKRSYNITFPFTEDHFHSKTFSKILWSTLTRSGVSGGRSRNHGQWRYGDLMQTQSLYHGSENGDDPRTHQWKKLGWIWIFDSAQKYYCLHPSQTKLKHQKIEGVIDKQGVKVRTSSCNKVWDIWLVYSINVW